MQFSSTRGDAAPRPAARPSRQYFSNIRYEMVPFLPARYTRVLEVGCGEGVFRQLLSPSSEVWGIEPETAAAGVASGALDRVLRGTYSEVATALPVRYFDLVICNDVIEHMSDPDAFLDSVSRHMTPGGSIVASIPNLRHWETLFELLVKKDWRYRESGGLDRTHLKFFTEKSIIRLLTDHRFAVEDIRGINGGAGRIKRMIFGAMTLATLGYYDDLRHRQFALRARLTE